MIPDLVAQIVSRVENASILLTGSVQRHEERPESDIDLLVIVPDVAKVVPWIGRVAHRTPLVKIVEADVEGVHVTLNFLGAGLFADMTSKPWKYYQFAKAEVLREDGHELASVRECILRWFSKRPDMAALWQNQEAIHRGVKRSRSEETLEFADTTDFAEYVDGIVNAEPSAAGDADKPRA
jgi:hypothetical protein